MKKLLIIGLAVFASPALAESTIKVPDNFKDTMVQTQAALERCIGATAAKLPNDTCNAVWNILAQIASLPVTPIVPDHPAPSPSPVPPAN
jgi:hypothetical protein